jgi:hypothetical protein
LLTQDLEVDHLVTGGSASLPFDSERGLTSGTITECAKVSSHFVHFDPRSRQQDVEGYITFKDPILGVIVFPESLGSTDYLFGLPRAQFASKEPSSVDSSGMEFAHGDSFEIDSDGTKLTLNLSARRGVDNIRVLTCQKPKFGFSLSGSASMTDPDTINFGVVDSGDSRRATLKVHVGECQSLVINEWNLQPVLNPGTNTNDVFSIRPVSPDDTNRLCIEEAHSFEISFNLTQYPPSELTPCKEFDYRLIIRGQYCSHDYEKVFRLKGYESCLFQIRHYLR